MKETGKRGRRPRKSNRSWLAEHFIGVWEKRSGTSLATYEVGEGRQLKMIDLVVVAGKIVVRTETETGQRKRLELCLPIWEDKQWDQMFELLAGRALFFGKLLLGELPEELNAACAEAGLELLPHDGSAFELFDDGERTDEVNSMTAQVLVRIAESLTTNPFLLFQLLGRGKEECLWELKKRRQKTAPSAQNGEDLPLAHVSTHAFLAGQQAGFYNISTDLSSLTYSIKADEFPDALLKWLDPLPLGGLEEELEGVFEEAYIQIARRAQAFGFGL